jgi:hypothetical protein
VTIPNSVTTIGNSAFRNNLDLTSVTIGESVTTIENNAFRNTGLTTVNFNAVNANVPSSDISVFGRNLTTVNIGNSVERIPNFAFVENASLTSVTIPNSVTTIGIGAFMNTGLTSVTIPNSVTTIGNGAFLNNRALMSINVEAGNSRFSSENGVLFNIAKNTLIAYPAGKTGDYIIPNSVTSIGGWAFENSRLTSVTIPNSVTSIGTNAFANNNLTSVTIPNSVTSIGASAFESNNLTSVTIGESVTSIGSSAFQDNNLTSVTIPNSVTSIGAIAFRSNRALMSIDVEAGNSRFSSENGVLFNIAKDTLITYPAGKTGDYTIPNSVTSIGDWAFESNNLTSVTIPNSVTSIRWGAFSGSSYLTEVVNYAKIPQEINHVFGNVSRSTITLFVPCDAIAAYRTAAVWQDFNIIGIHISSQPTTIPATCATEGEQADVCSVCGDKINVVIIPRLQIGELDWDAEKIIITNECELRCLATLVNSGNTFEGQTITLGADITLTSWWIPIGNTYGGRFEGVFDGNGYSISGLHISGSFMHAGFFGVVGSKGQIKNLTINIDEIDVSNAITGGLAGYYGSLQPIENVTVNIRDRIFVNSDFESATIGGLVGSTLGAAGITIRNSCVNGDVSANSSRDFALTGGLIGAFSGNAIISNSYTTGDVSAFSYSNSAKAGGLVGQVVSYQTPFYSVSSSITISNSFSTSNISASANNGSSFSGGLIGLKSNYCTANISRSYASGAISATTQTASDAFSGGIIGSAGNNRSFSSVFYNSEEINKAIGNIDGAIAGINSRTFEQLQQRATFSGWDFNGIWGIFENTSTPFFLSSLEWVEHGNFEIMAIPSQLYADVQIRPTVNVRLRSDKTPLVEGVNFFVSYGENRNVATGGNVNVRAVLGLETTHVVDFSISPKELTITGATAQSRPFNGTTTATITGASVIGAILGDNVSVRVTGEFDDKNAGTGKTVSATASLTGVDASNYILTETNLTLTANITRVPLVITLEPRIVEIEVSQGTPNFSNYLSYLGLVGNDTQEVINGEITISHSYIAGTSQTGLYAITLGMGTLNALNYNISLDNANLFLHVIANRTQGAIVLAPTLASATTNSITINAVTAPQN